MLVTRRLWLSLPRSVREQILDVLGYRTVLGRYVEDVVNDLWNAGEDSLAILLRRRAYAMENPRRSVRVSAEPRPYIEYVYRPVEEDISDPLVIVGEEIRPGSVVFLYDYPTDPESDTVVVQDMRGNRQEVRRASLRGPIRVVRGF